MIGLSQSPRQGAKKYVDAMLGEIGENGDVIGAPEGKVLGKIVDQKPMNSTLTNGLIIDGVWNFLQTIYPMPNVILE